MEKVNVRGGINALRINQTLTLPKDSCKPSTVRMTAAALKADTGKSFTVSVRECEIVVKRKS